jgi:predicted RNA binding protein YcfA (HicA-like mRNA interferase family)
MSRLPAVDAATVERVLLQAGFELVRQKGAHVFYRHPDGRTTTVPHHRGRDLAKPLLADILREAGISRDEFLELLRQV